MRDLCFLDTETTGLSYRLHEIIDIWAARCDPETLEIKAEAGGLVLPLDIENADPMALKINGYDESRWDEEARPWRTVWREVEPLTGDATIVGSNPAFDLRFIERMLKHHMVRGNAPTTHWAVDTASMAHPLQRAGVIRSCSLGALCEYFGVELEERAHSARGDVLRTIEVYRRLITVL